MKKKQYIFRATELDQFLLNGLDKVISEALEVKKVGPVKCMRFACKVGQEMLVNGKVNFKKDVRFKATNKFTLIKIDLDKFDLPRVNAMAKGLAKISHQSKPVPIRAVMQASLRLAEIWLVDHAAQAKRIDNGVLEKLMQYAIVMTVQPGPGVGPSSLINSFIEVSKQVQQEDAQQKNKSS